MIPMNTVPGGDVGLIFAHIILPIAIVSTETDATLLIVITLTTAPPPFALKWLYAKGPP